MTSKEKYDSLNSDDKRLITVLYTKGKSINYISERFGLSHRFLTYHLFYKFNYTIPILFGTKEQPYYKNEMNYGALELSYNFEDLNANEIEAYNNYKEKNVAYYEF